MNLHALLDFGPLQQEFGTVMKAFWGTIRLALLSGIGSLILGTVLAAMRVSPTPVLRGRAPCTSTSSVTRR